MAANHYSEYLRDSSDGAQSRAEPACRPRILCALLLMALLQVLSSAAILLHLTGYLNEVGFSATQKEPLEEAEVPQILANALKDERKKDRTKCTKALKGFVPAAHLPIKVPIDYSLKGEIKPMMIQWDDDKGHLQKLKYHNGRILVQEGGWYYVYAKTCFRYYNIEAGEGSLPQYLQEGNTQLIQYIFHERHTQQPAVATVLTKTGSTKRWSNSGYNMYCEQQGGLFRLKKGDGLYVTVSNTWMLDPEQEGSYFGAFKVSD